MGIDGNIHFVHKPKQLIRYVLKVFKEKYSKFSRFSEYFAVDKCFNILQIKEFSLKSEVLINFKLNYVKLNHCHALQTKS